MTTKNVIVADIYSKHENGLAELVSLACSFDSEIHIEYDTRAINAKSIMGVMLLTAEKGDSVNIVAEGSDEEAAVEAIAEFLQ